MGLAGRKQKQRIPADPRNLSWADDASRFGLSYLSKFGWNASQGLGSSGDGVKTHLKVQQKLDMMGIGAQHQRDPDGIAWKQNKDFEALLKRLNDSAEEHNGAEVKDAGASAGVRESELANAFVPAREDESATKKKRKRKDTDPDNGENARKKCKKEKHDKSSTVAPTVDPTTPSEPSSTSSSSELAPEPKPTMIPRPMAHRARIRAAKRLAGKSASAIAEILGIASSSASPVPTPSRCPSPSPPEHSLDHLTTSTKSVADYFKEKLRVRSSASTPASSTPGLGSGSGSGSGSSPDEEETPPRRGIGSRAPAVPPSSETIDDHDPLERPDLSEEKRRRKAEKRKRREAGATPEGGVPVVEAQVERGNADETREMSAKDQKLKQRKDEKGGHADGTDCDPLAGSKKKSKKEREKRRG